MPSLHQTMPMKLKAVHVRKFRNIVDAEDFEIDPDVTALVGKNESGKTAILEALYRINPVHKAEFEENPDYPRWRLSADRRAKAIDAVPVVRAVFTIEDEDRVSVEAVFGPGVLLADELIVEKFYNEESTYTTRIDAVRAFNNITTELASPPSLVSSLSDPERHLDIAAAALNNLSAPIAGDGWESTDLAELIAEIQRRAGTLDTHGAISALLASRLPRMFYFADYQTLPGRINVTELAGAEEPGQSDLQTARALLKLAYTDVNLLTDDDFEERTAELEAVSNELTSRVFQYWKQNEDLSIQIVADKVTKAVPHTGQTAVVRYLDVRVRDARHGFTNNFAQRSSGFKWFFSFLAAFSEFENYEHGVVVLLDEPALTLHGRAQADFLRFIDEELSRTAQVIYTTHSPFMVDASQLHRVRIVEDKGSTIGSVVSAEALSVGEDSLFPLQAALGYDIAQNLFVGPDNLMVEGTSDFTYLTVVSDHIRALGRAGLDARWRMLPAGSASNIPTFVALVGRSLDVTVLIDGSTRSSVQKLANLADKGYLSNKRLFLTDQFTTVSGSDIEDLFTPSDYLTLYNGAFGAQIEVDDLSGSDRIVGRIGRFLGGEFSEHGRPAEYLLRNRDNILPSLSKTTIDNFETLFIAINDTLTAP